MRHRLALFILALVLPGAPLAAQVTISFTGTVTTAGLGWALNNEVTFSFTVANNFSTGAINSFSSTTNRWAQEKLTDDTLFSNVTFTGAGGTYNATPSSSSEDPNFHLDTIDNSSPTDYLHIYAGADESDIGLKAPDLATVKLIEVDSLRFGEQLTFSGSYTNPATYLSALLGNYTITSGTLTIDGYSDSAGFALTGQTLSISAVPEPSSYALLAGLAAFAGIIWHRRRTLFPHRS